MYILFNFKGKLNVENNGIDIAGILSDNEHDIEKGRAGNPGCFSSYGRKTF
jgi:hypothetical protein